MAKLQFLYNEATSYMCYEDPKYNDMAIRVTINALGDLLRYDGLITVKEALKKFGIDTKKIPKETLLRYWTDKIDISYEKTENDNEFLLTFNTKK